MGVWPLELKSGGNPAKPEAWTKVPHSAVTRRRASTTDLRHWTTFEAALACLHQCPELFDGLGFVLGAGWAGVDLDACRDPETGEIVASVWEWIRRFRFLC